MPQRTRTLHLLDHPVRRRALRVISEAPGIHLRALGERLEAPFGTVRYHVQVLEDEHLLTSERRGRYRCYFQNDGRYDERERARLAAIASPKTAGMLAHLRSEPRSHQSGIADAVDLGCSTVHHHLTQLEDLGLVESERDGSAVRYVLNLEPHEIDHLPEPAD